MKNPAVRYGLYAVIFSVIWTLIQHVLGYNTTKHEIGQYTRMVGSFVFWILVFVTVFSLRKQQGGALSAGEGFKAGVLMSFIYSVGIAIWYALYAEVINTQYKPSLMAFEKAKLEAANAAADTIAAKMKEVDMTSGGTVRSYLFLVCFMMLFGIVLSLLAALIAKRKKAAA
jgi:hypothetical protein